MPENKNNNNKNILGLMPENIIKDTKEEIENILYRNVMKVYQEMLS